LPALLVGAGEPLGVGEWSCDVDGDGDGLPERDGAELEGAPGKPLAEPGSGPPETPWPAVPGPCVGVTGAPKTLNGVFGPPKRPMPAMISAPTSSMLAAAPSTRRSRRR
jgi:hypothetical protein